MKSLVTAILLAMADAIAFSPLPSTKISTALNYKVKQSAFQEIIGEHGLAVVKHTKVPSKFESNAIDMHFPSNWHAPKSAIWRKKESDEVSTKLYSEFQQLGVIDEPYINRKFKELDCHLIGGSCRLQPGKTMSQSYLIHQFVGLFSLWDDVIEDDYALGVDSCDRVRRILNAREESPEAVEAIACEDPRDACYMVCWEKLFADVETASKQLYIHFSASILTWIGGVEDELDHLCVQDPSEIDIEMEWNNRIKSVGCIPIFDLLLYGAGFFDNANTDLKYCDFDDIKWTYSCLVREINEIASIPKDIVDDCGSLFTSTMMLKELSFDETLDHFRGRFNKSVAKFDRLATDLVAKQNLEEGQNKLKVVLDALRISAVGLGEWHMPTASSEGKGMRYNSVKIVRPSEKKVFDFQISHKK